MFFFALYRVGRLQEPCHIFDDRKAFKVALGYPSRGGYQGDNISTRQPRGPPVLIKLLWNMLTSSSVEHPRSFQWRNKRADIGWSGIRWGLFCSDRTPGSPVCRTSNIQVLRRTIEGRRRRPSAHPFGGKGRTRRWTSSTANKYFET